MTRQGAESKGCDAENTRKPEKTRENSENTRISGNQQTSHGNFTADTSRTTYYQFDTYSVKSRYLDRPTQNRGVARAARVLSGNSARPLFTKGIIFEPGAIIYESKGVPMGRNSPGRPAQLALPVWNRCQQGRHHGQMVCTRGARDGYHMGAKGCTQGCHVGCHMGPVYSPIYSPMEPLGPGEPLEPLGAARSRWAWKHARTPENT